MSKDLKLEVIVAPVYSTSTDCRVVLEVNGREAIRSEIFNVAYAAEKAQELRRKLGLLNRYKIEIAHSKLDFKVQEIEAKDFIEAFAKIASEITDNKASTINITKIPS